MQFRRCNNIGTRSGDVARKVTMPTTVSLNCTKTIKPFHDQILQKASLEAFPLPNYLSSTYTWKTIYNKTYDWLNCMSNQK